MQNVVGEYMFYSRSDADLAQKEAEKVEMLEEKLAGTDDIKLLYKVYNKCIETRSFKTPIGLDFMRKIKRRLEESDELPGEILPIPLFTSYDGTVYESAKEPAEKMRMQIREQEKNNHKNTLRILAAIIALLVCMVIAMFAIVVNSNSPNIINYENAIINKYASWEEELNQREDEIREKKKSLNIDE